MAKIAARGAKEVARVEYRGKVYVLTSDSRILYRDQYGPYRVWSRWRGPLDPARFRAALIAYLEGRRK